MSRVSRAEKRRFEADHPRTGSSFIRWRWRPGTKTQRGSPGQKSLTIPRPQDPTNLKSLEADPQVLQRQERRELTAESNTGREELDGIPPIDPEHTRTCNLVADVYA